MASNSNFLGLSDLDAGYETSAAVVVPVPYERTVSYGKGTERGPAAIIAASSHVELYDEVLDEEPYRRGIHTAPAVDVSGEPEVVIAGLEATARDLFGDGKFPVFLGGEHALTLGPVRAAAMAYEDLSVLQFDAHGDLRDTYEGTPWSHACVMRRVAELGVSIVGVGIRSISSEEIEFARGADVRTFWSHRIAYGDEWMDTAINALSENVYVTFDVDYFDPSLMPATGTPVPGGGGWHDTMRFLAHVFEQRNVVGMDVVELAPVASLHGCDFTVANLVHRAIGYRFHAWP